MKPKRQPTWGSELYSPEFMHRRINARGGATWSDVLRRKQWQRVAFMLGWLAGAIFCALMVVGTDWLLSAGLEGNNLGFIILVDIVWLYGVYIFGRDARRMYYYLYVDKRDIAKVLESQIDYGRQNNIWPL